MDYLPIDIASAIGEAVLHSLWQGAAIYCGYRLSTQSLQHPARLHDLGLLSLGLLVSAFVATAYIVWPAQAMIPSVEIAEAWQPASLTTGGPNVAADLTWAAMLGYAYAIGVAAYLTWLALDHVRSRRLLRSDRIALPAEWQEPFRLAQARFAPHLAVGVCLSRHVTTVVTVGILRPVVLYPVMLVNQLSAEEAELILLHELAHLRRYDHLTIYVQQLLRAVVFFHPAAHLLSRHIDTAREYACDDLVVAGSSRKAYAKTLLHLATQTLSQPNNPLAMSISKTPFSGRIHRLFGAPKTSKLPGLIFALPLALFALTVYAVAPATTSDGALSESDAAATLPAPGALSSVEPKTDTIPSTDPSLDRGRTPDVETTQGTTTPTSTAPTTSPVATDAEIAAIVAEAMRDIPTEAELQRIIADAMRNMPSAEELTAQVREALKNMPSEAELKHTIDEALKNVPSQAEIDEMVREARASVPSEAEIQRIQADAKRAQAEAQRAQADAQRLQQTDQKLQVTTDQRQEETTITHTDAAGKTHTTTSGNSTKSTRITADPNAKDIDYFIDDRTATAEQVNALNPDTIERVDVTKVEGKRKAVRVYLKK